jgi:hypothetical protein
MPMKNAELPYYAGAAALTLFGVGMFLFGRMEIKVQELGEGIAGIFDWS